MTPVPLSWHLKLSVTPLNLQYHICMFIMLSVVYTKRSVYNLYTQTTAKTSNLRNYKIRLNGSVLVSNALVYCTNIHTHWQWEINKLIVFVTANRTEKANKYSPHYKSIFYSQEGVEYCWWWLYIICLDDVTFCCWNLTDISSKRHQTVRTHKII